MGINDLTKKYSLNEIVTGDSIFCATGITSGDLVSGIEIQGNEFISETLVTHKSSGLKKVIKLKQNLKWYAWLIIDFTIKNSNSVPSSIG